jgi:glycosyltransferase involved in cell wall biosynthesis
VPQARFVVVGEGIEREPLLDLTRELDLGDRVLFLGARADVPDLLQTFDVGVLASHFESFSNSILEYLASGLPVVVTDVGGAREVVREGQDGFLVEPRRPEQMAEKIRFLLDQPGGARSWRTNDTIQPGFQLEGMVEGHERLYERLVSSGD